MAFKVHSGGLVTNIIFFQCLILDKIQKMFNYKFSHILAYAPENLELNKWSFIVQNTSFIRIC